MVDERKRMFLQPMTTDEINEKVWKHHNYNCLDAYDDLSTLQAADHGRVMLKRTTPLWFGMTLLSSYNITRMTVLSNSGRVGAVAGVLTGAFMTYKTMTIWKIKLQIHRDI